MGIAALDLAAAGILFTLSGTVIILAIAGAGRLAGQPIYPLMPMFVSIQSAPWDYFWVYAMLFLTILPTMLHFAAASFALIGVLGKGSFGLVARWAEDADPIPATSAPLAIGAIWTASLRSGRSIFPSSSSSPIPAMRS